MGARESTPQGGAGATTPSAGGAGATTPSAGGATASLAGRGQAAQESKTAATDAKAAAETTKAAADETTTTAAAVSDKIDDVKNAASATTVSGGRMKRQDTPTTCATFQTMVGDMNDAINLKTDAKYAEATKLGKLLAAVVAATVGCTSDDVAALNAAKTAVTAAVAVAVADSNQQQNLIKAAIETINAAIAEITAVNILLVESGQSTLADPGTTLATVTAPSLATDAAAGGATTAAAGAGATTPGAGAGATTPAGGAGETTPGSMVSMESTPPSTMVSTANPGRKLFGKRSRGSIFNYKFIIGFNWM